MYRELAKKMKRILFFSVSVSYGTGIWILFTKSQWKIFQCSVDLESTLNFLYGKPIKYWDIFSLLYSLLKMPLVFLIIQCIGNTVNMENFTVDYIV